MKPPALRLRMPTRRRPARDTGRAGERRRGTGRFRGRKRSLLVLLLVGVFLASPMAPASADPWSGDACRPAESPVVEKYGSGIDGMVKPPGYPGANLKKKKPEELSYYDRYGTMGQYWYAVDMDCSDVMAMVGNSMSNMVFTIAKAIDRTTITVYQSAMSGSLLNWLKDTIDGVITQVGHTFGAGYWSWVVILGAMWLAWWGLLRKRATATVEGVVWMVVAMTALVWLINRPGDFTTVGTKVSSAATTAFNAALPQAGSKGSTCIPPANKEQKKQQEAVQMDATTANANRLWSALVCKPWLMGLFGTANPNDPVVKKNSANLLSAQATDLWGYSNPKRVDLGQKGDNYKAISKNIKEEHKDIYPIFQGKSWTTQLAVAFGALFAALAAGILILIIAITLIVMKIAFLLLLVAGPIFLGIGIHPGVGRVITMRWAELLLSILLKQAALIGVLAMLLWCYSLILSRGLPWGLQIMLVALVTLAALIYRKPFQHLFASVGYSATGSRGKGEAELDRSVDTARRRTLAVPATAGAAGQQLARWRQRGESRKADSTADGVPTAPGDGTEGEPGRSTGDETTTGARGRARTGGPGTIVRRGDAPPLDLTSRDRRNTPDGQPERPGGRATGERPGTPGDRRPGDRRPVPSGRRAASGDRPAGDRSSGERPAAPDRRPPSTPWTSGDGLGSRNGSNGDTPRAPRTPAARTPTPRTPPPRSDGGDTPRRTGNESGSGGGRSGWFSGGERPARPAGDGGSGGGGGGGDAPRRTERPSGGGGRGAGETRTRRSGPGAPSSDASGDQGTAARSIPRRRNGENGPFWSKSSGKRSEDAPSLSFWLRRPDRDE